ncbi:hypothetical protein KS4_30770 [Poriferisphaera corsica]|uniref:Thioredoxin domain-containing protein n=2 Tax=Poriferisphaera corsica TaxID=2528020 RepID=A0A517YXP4_9BACT|nr:hypothetical protein KS4_30770 [Poriferisphaera corsica]
MQTSDNNEEIDHSRSLGRIRGLQRFTVWVVALLALAGTAVMTLSVLRDGAPGARNRISDVSPEGKVPLLLDAPNWELTDAFNQTVSQDDYRGKVVIYDFIFTECALVCPIMSMRMAEVQDTLKKAGVQDQVRFVSMSVDGKNDTPEVLNRYGYDDEVGVGADPAMWHFVTGDQQKVWEIVEKQFLLPLENQPEVTGMPIAHSAKFVLVDKQGRIYNYYDLDHSEERSALLADIERLMRE